MLRAAFRSRVSLMSDYSAHRAVERLAQAGDIAGVLVALRGLMMREVGRIARRYPGLDREDLIQQASLGVMLGVERWVPERGPLVVVCEYAVRETVGQYASRNLTTVSIRRSKRELWLQRHAGRLWHELTTAHPAAAPHEIAGMIAAASPWETMTADDVVAALTLHMSPGDDQEISRVQADEPEESDDDLRALINRALAELPEREAHIVRRYQLDDVTFEAIASDLGISRERVRRLYQRAMAELRELMTALIPDDCR